MVIPGSAMATVVLLQGTGREVTNYSILGKMLPVLPSNFG